MTKLEETFEAWLTADLEAKKAASEPKAEAAPEYVTKADLQAFVAEMSKAIVAQVEAVKAEVTAEVEKALPVRSAGAGRVGGQDQAGDESDTDVVAYLTKKGRSEEGWDERDKELVTAIFVGAAKQGLK